MDTRRLQQESDTRWVLRPAGGMRAPAVLYASEDLLQAMDDKVLEQLAGIAALPGIETAAYAMPDAHWGYGFPIGGVAAFDPDRSGVVSAGGVGFDIACGVRTLLTPLEADAVRERQAELSDALFRAIPAGVGSTGRIRLTPRETDAMLTGGAAWAVRRGHGDPRDLARIEHGGTMPDAVPDDISDRARERQRDEMGTLGSGNHYLEVQEVAAIYDPAAADAFGLREGQVVVSLHCGSRGLGHQVATEFSRRMLACAARHGIRLRDPELACAPIRSPEGQAYLGAMRAAANCALANRQILTQLVRDAFTGLLGPLEMPLLYDVSHNICQVETHLVAGRPRSLYVHRKGATRALGPGTESLPEPLRAAGQPVLIGGSMGTASYVLAGQAGNGDLSFQSACHGAGRRMSRGQAARQWQGRDVVQRLERQRVLVRSPSLRGVAEEAPGAYKDVHAVVDATERAGLARRVARLVPLICLKG